jgi:hypothetical protein
MKTTLQSLQESISNAVDMIDQSQLVSADLLLQQSTKYSTNSLDFTNANSLLDKCEEVTNSYKKTKPVIRVIHHLACSGGTLISKCIASQPNVFLLSEIHPTTKLHLGEGKAKYTPTDISSQCSFGNLPELTTLKKLLFADEIFCVNSHLISLGGTLVLRDHTHSDFTFGEACAQHSVLAETLESKFQLLRLATIRNPIDSYCSLKSNKWLHFSPPSFEEYCRRFLIYISEYNDEQILKYEDIVATPELHIEKITQILQLKYNNSFEHIFDIHNVSGGSGRKNIQIELPKRRELSNVFVEEINTSKSFLKITKKFGYEL